MEKDSIGEYMTPHDTFIIQRLIAARTLFLSGEVSDETTRELAEALIIADHDRKAPIRIIINSIGGYIESGLFLIDVIHGLRSPVHTIISGTACSMAGIVSICGAKRFMTKNSVWMGHEGVYAEADYMSKLRDRHKYYENLEDKIDDIMTTYTKLSPKDLKKLHSGELWLSPDECLSKGVIDRILK